LLVAFISIPPALAQQRRVFTNEDFRSAPPAAPAPTTPAAPAAGASGAEAIPATPAAPATEAAAGSPAKLPEGIALVQHLQEVLQRYRSEIGVQQEQEVDSLRLARLSSMQDLVTQLIVQNQLFIGDLQVKQQQAAAEAAAQAGAQPGP